MPIYTSTSPVTRGPFAHGETVYILRAATLTDPYSGETTGQDWGNATMTEVSGVGVADGGSLEPTQDARNSVESDFDLILPYGTDVGPADRVIVRGETCEVVGRPFDWRHPMTGWEAGKIARVKVVTG